MYKIKIIRARPDPRDKLLVDLNMAWRSTTHGTWVQFIIDLSDAI